MEPADLRPPQAEGKHVPKIVLGAMDSIRGTMRKVLAGRKR